MADCDPVVAMLRNEGASDAMRPHIRVRRPTTVGASIDCKYLFITLAPFSCGLQGELNSTGQAGLAIGRAPLRHSYSNKGNVFSAADPGWDIRDKQLEISYCAKLASC